MIFTRSRPPDVDRITMFQATLDRRLAWTAHISTKIVAANKAMHSIYAMLNRNSRLDLKIKTNLYKIVLRPIIMYAAPAWNQASNAQKKKLQTFRNRILRIIVNASWFMRNSRIHQDLDIPDITTFIDDTARAYFDKLNEHPNPSLTNRHRAFHAA